MGLPCGDGVPKDDIPYEEMRRKERGADGR